MALVFFALENPESRSSEEIIQDAITGKEILAGLAKNSMAADRCTQTLQVSIDHLSCELGLRRPKQLFDKLPDRLKGGRTRPLATSSHKKRQAVSPAPTTSTSTSGPSVIKDTQRDESGPQRASSFPVKTGQDISYDQPQYALTLNFNEPYPQPATGNNMGIGPDNLAQASTNGSLAFTHAGLQPSHMPQATTYGLPDLSAMMFPTGDPFAYPNQPMTTLEDHNFVNTPDSCGQGGAPPGSTYSAHSPSRTSSIFSVHQQTCNPDGGAGSSSSSMNDVTGSNGGFDPSVEAHIFDPLQPYLSGAEYQQGMADLIAGLGPIDGGAGEGDGKSGAEFRNWWSANPSAAANWGL
ncbi:MAG: hypothetical protein LQ340_001710 [Diploschistes diacapsis]|nr:MAG: hypothetical protein LQ340_001710 [Diploschistes diacapsis]